jgi:hypothetical protein
MKKRLAIGLKVLIIVFGLCPGFVYGKYKYKNPGRFQADLILGLTAIKNYPATTLGLGLDYYNNRYIVTGQFLMSQRILSLGSEAKNYYNLDILAGLYNSKNNLAYSVSAGIGLAFRNNHKSGISTPYYSNEKSYITLGLPLRGKIDYALGKHITLGLIGYSNINFKQIIIGLNINLGYRF